MAANELVIAILLIVFSLSAFRNPSSGLDCRFIEIFVIVRSFEVECTCHMNDILHVYISSTQVQITWSSTFGSACVRL